MEPLKKNDSRLSKKIPRCCQLCTLWPCKFLLWSTLLFRLNKKDKLDTN
jgi:hypothetical protein